jgi:hypothetical protein
MVYDILRSKILLIFLIHYASNPSGEAAAEGAGSKNTEEKGPAQNYKLKSDGKNERVKIEIRGSIKIPCSQLYHILTTEAQCKMIPKDIPNKFCFFGMVVSRGKNKGSWNV